jgi:Protein of unknown function (DUF3383)
MARTLVDISVLGNTRTPKAQGFGVTACVAYHTHNADTYREYEELSDMVTDGFTTYEPGYLLAQAVFSQSPRPTKICLARGPIVTDTWDVVVTTATEGAVISVEVREPGTGTWVTCSRTVPAASSTTAEAAALELLIEAVAGVASSASSATVTVTPVTSGQLIMLRNPQNCTIDCKSADPGYAATLSALKVAGADFFFVATECNSELSIEAAAAWAESNKRMYGWNTNNSAEKSGSSTLFSGQKSLGYEFSFGFFGYDPSEYMGARACGFAGARDPGSYTISSKSLKATASNLTSTEQTNLDTAGANYYIAIANGLNGVSGVYNGGITSGNEYFIDTIHGREWWIARTQERLATVLASQEKVDFTDQGVQVLVAEIDAQNQQAVRQKLFAADPAPTAEALPVANISAANKAVRLYPSLKATATYAGAIHATQLVATFTV